MSGGVATRRPPKRDHRIGRDQATVIPAVLAGPSRNGREIAVTSGVERATVAGRESTLSAPLWAAMIDSGFHGCAGGRHRRRVEIGLVLAGDGVDRLEHRELGGTTPSSTSKASRASGRSRSPTSTCCRRTGPHGERAAARRSRDPCHHAAAPAGERSAYLKLRDRVSYEFALVSAAAAVVGRRWHDDGACASRWAASARGPGACPRRSGAVRAGARRRVVPAGGRDRARGRAPAKPERLQGRAARRCIVAALKRATR